MPPFPLPRISIFLSCCANIVYFALQFLSEAFNSFPVAANSGSVKPTSPVRFMDMFDFQFFPSCCGGAARGREARDQLSILSQLLLSGLTAAGSSRLLTLSILSQLLQRREYGWAWGHGKKTFNSFPVAAGRRGGRGGRPRGASGCFQFFPSCCVRKMARSFSAWKASFNSFPVAAIKNGEEGGARG
jgi:hypothetical protein